MSIRPTDLLALAGTLVNQIDECSQRAATSRGYYAAYHACQQWHDTLSQPGSNTGPNGGKHQQLINRLKNPSSGLPQAQRTLSKTLGMKLEVMRNRRVTADYKLADSPLASESATQVAQACAMLNQIP